MLTGGLPYGDKIPMVALRLRITCCVHLKLELGPPLAGLVELVNRALAPAPASRPADGIFNRGPSSIAVSARTRRGARAQNNATC